MKDMFGAIKDKYTSAFFCTILLFILNNLPPYTDIQHYTIIKFDRFATLYYYLALKSIGIAYIRSQLTLV